MVEVQLKEKCVFYNGCIDMRIDCIEPDIAKNARDLKWKGFFLETCKHCKKYKVTEVKGEKRKNERLELKIQKLIKNEGCGTHNKRFEENLRDFVSKVSKNLRLDEEIIFDALESKRNFSAINYWNEGGQIPAISFILGYDSLKKRAEDGWNKYYELTKKSEEEVQKLRAEVMEIKKVQSEGAEDVDDAYWSVELNVTCPYCKNYQDVFGQYQEESHYESVDVCGSGEFSDFQVECDKCGKYFDVKSVQY